MLLKEVLNDVCLAQVRADLLLGHTVPGFTMEHDLLLYKGWLVLSAYSKLIPLVLREYHLSCIGRHSGETRTYQRLAGDVFLERDEKVDDRFCPPM